MKIVGWLVLSICLFFSSSCSFKHGYPFLDDYIAWKMRGYVTLKGEQKSHAKKVIKDFHRWHRETQLNRYADYLAQLKQGMLEKPIVGHYLHAESDKLQLLLDDSMNFFLPGLTEIASSLSDAQIKQFQRKLKKERDQYQKDYIDSSVEKIQKRRIRNITRYIGPFFGRFTTEQKAMLKTWEESLFPYADLMVEQQLNWEKKFLKAMSLQHDIPLLQRELSELMLHRTDNWNKRLEEQLHKNQLLTFDMLAKLFNSQTPKQREKLIAKFDQYIRDLRSLSRS